MKVHLNHKLLKGLLEGRVSVAQERRLLAHLDGDCEKCELFLAALGDEKAAQLYRIFTRAENASALDPGAERRPAADLAGSRRGWSRSRLLLLPAAALGLLAVVGLGFALLRPAAVTGDGGERTKGTAAGDAGAEIELTVARLVPGSQNGSGFERLPPGGGAASSELLAFRIDTSGPCYLYLACQAGDALQLLTPGNQQEPVLHPGGAYVPEIAGHPAAFPLTGYRGRLRFIAVCAGRRLEHPRAALQAVVESVEHRTALPGGVLSFAVRNVTVSEGVKLP